MLQCILTERKSVFALLLIVVDKSTVSYNFVLNYDQKIKTHKVNLIIVSPCFLNPEYKDHMVTIYNGMAHQWKLDNATVKWVK